MVLAEAVMVLQKRTLDCSLALTLLQFNWSALTTAIILDSLWKFLTPHLQGKKSRKYAQSIIPNAK